MSRVKEALQILLLATWLLISLGLAWEGIQLRPAVESGLRAANGTLREADLTLKNLREASETWKKASVEQASQTTAAMSSVTVAAKEFSILASSTNASINSVLLPTLTESIRSQNASLLEGQKDLQENLKAMLGATHQLQTTLASADAVVSDPAIKQSVDNLATATGNAATATAEASASMAKIHEGVDYEVNSLIKPIGKVKAAALIVIRFIGRFFGF